MATNTERFGFTLPSGQDPASIIPLNLNTQNIEKYLGMTQDMLAPLYDATEGTYEVDDIVTHDSILYKCIEAIETPEAFDETKWVETTAVSEGGGGAGAIEKTQAEYNELTPAQKTNGTIYMVQDDGTGDYEYHTNQAETIVVRINRTTSEIEWFFVDYTFTGGSVEQIPSELTAYLPSSTISGVAYDTSLETEMGYVAINNQGGFGLYPTDYSREIAGTVKCLLKNTDGTEQANTYTDPYEGTGDAVNRIYYMGTEYANTNGGSGEGAGYSETVLFEESGSTYAGIKELSDNISEYDELIFRSIYENSQTIYEQRVSTSLIEEIGYIQNPTSSSNHISLEFGYDQSFYRMVRGENDNELNIFQVSGTRHVITIIGVKYEGSAGGGGSSVEYSTNEHIVGTWIDGEDVFEKTFVLRKNNVNQYIYSANEFLIGLNNVDKVWIEQATLIRSGGQYVDMGITENEQVAVVFDITNGAIYYQSTHNHVDIIITLRYTKVVS